MDDSFELPVLYKGEELLFPARLLLQGYTHKFQVYIEGREFLFEQDEEGRYRALIDPSDLESSTKPDIEALQAVAGSLAAITG